MPEPAAPRYGGIRAPLRPSANGSARPPPAPPARRRPSRIASIRMALIAGIGVLILLVIFIVQNAHAVHITFFGAHASVSLAVALLVAAVAGALVMAVAGTARITQLRLTMRRTRRRASTGGQAHVPARDSHPDRDPGSAGPATEPQP
jgi:putative membrane protein